MPDGIDEVLPREAVRIETARRQLLDLFSRWGYDLVITPHIEYLESLLTGAGTYFWGYHHGETAVQAKTSTATVSKLGEALAEHAAPAERAHRCQLV